MCAFSFVRAWRAYVSVVDKHKLSTMACTTVRQFIVVSSIGASRHRHVASCPTQSHYLDTRRTSPNTNPITVSTKQSSCQYHFSALMCAGDILSQVAIEKRGFNRGQKYDVTRSLRFLGFGIVLVGPVYRTWYRMLDSTFRMTKFGSLKMVFFDQCVFAPSFILFFFIAMAAMKGDSMREIQERINKDYFAVMYTNYQVWPLVQACNFTFVPVQHRVLVINLVSVGWNTYLAWKSEHQLSDKDVSH